MEAAPKEAPAQKVEAPKPASQPAQPSKPSSGAASAVGTEQFFEELDHKIHGKMNFVAPAAARYMRLYRVFPEEIQNPSGPKGII